MDIIADMKIDLAAMRSVPLGLRARIYAWLDDYHLELAPHEDPAPGALRHPCCRRRYADTAEGDRDRLTSAYRIRDVLYHP
jgi:hypothetical protein